MRKRILSIVMLVALLLTACGQQSVVLTWQEQYDLGVRYLSEGNYEEAILAFTAAIEIDSKKEDAYVRLSEAYAGQGDEEMAKSVLQDAIDALGALEKLVQALEQYLAQEQPDEAIYELAVPCVLEQDTQGIIANEEYVPKIMLLDNGRFCFKVNLHESMGWVNGTYQMEYDGPSLVSILFAIEDKTFVGANAEGLTQFRLDCDENNVFHYAADGAIGMTNPNDAFYLWQYSEDLLPKPYVTNGYYEKIDHSEYAIPKVMLAGASAKAANDKIYEELYPYIEDLHENFIDGLIQGGPYGMSYSWNTYDDVISIIVKVGKWAGGWEDFYSYNISAKTGELLALPQLLQHYGMTEDAFYEKATATMVGAISRVEPVEGAELDEGTLKMFDEWYQQDVEITTSSENMANIRPYINEEGRFCMAAKISAMADWLSYKLLDVETGEELEMPTQN